MLIASPLLRQPWVVDESARAQSWALARTIGLPVRAR